jgi:hypothetical protein
MTLLQNKRTKAEYYVTDAEFEDIKKGGHMIKFNVLKQSSEQAEKKAQTTVEVIGFIKSKQTQQDAPKEEITAIEPEIVATKKYKPKQNTK